MKDYSYRQEFRHRLSELRIQHGVSARDMSLSLGLSEGYINKVENGRIMPTMKTFFDVCDYLEITPLDFFNTGAPFPMELNIAVEEINKLKPDQRERIISLMKDINQHR